MKILIGDDHSVVRRGVIQIIKDAYPFSVITECADGDQMFKLCLRNKYDLIISDISMPSRNGIEFIHEVREAQNNTPILVLSMHSAEQYAARVIKAGASGYLNKESAPEELIHAIESLKLGKKYITNDVALLIKDFKQNINVHNNLSNREFEVFKLLAAGEDLPTISKKLNINVNTVSTYKTRLLTKMQLKSVADITRYAVKNGLV